MSVALLPKLPALLPDLEVLVLRGVPASESAFKTVIISADVVLAWCIFLSLRVCQITTPHRKLPHKQRGSVIYTAFRKGRTGVGGGAQEIVLGPGPQSRLMQLCIY